jgi:hypothetical protein
LTFSGSTHVVTHCHVQAGGGAAAVGPSKLLRGQASFCAWLIVSLGLFSPQFRRWMAQKKKRPSSLPLLFLSLATKAVSPPPPPPKRSPSPLSSIALYLTNGQARPRLWLLQPAREQEMKKTLALLRKKARKAFPLPSDAGNPSGRRREKGKYRVQNEKMPLQIADHAGVGHLQAGGPDVGEEKQGQLCALQRFNAHMVT